jgi:hypothetical protein
MPDSVLMCLMKKCPIYAGFFLADKKSTTESTTENGPQTRHYINREIITGEAQYFLGASFC